MQVDFVYVEKRRWKSSQKITGVKMRHFGNQKPKPVVYIHTLPEVRTWLGGERKVRQNITAKHIENALPGIGQNWAFVSKKSRMDIDSLADGRESEPLNRQDFVIDQQTLWSWSKRNELHWVEMSHDHMSLKVMYCCISKVGKSTICLTGGDSFKQNPKIF